MKCFIKLVKILFWKNRKTYRLTMDIVYKENVWGGGYKLKQLMQLVRFLFSLRTLNKKEKLEIAAIKEQGDIYNLPESKTKFYLPGLNLNGGEFIQNKIYLERNYFERRELDLIKEQVQGTVLDIGANIGNHTLYFVNECKAGKVYVFEPSPETFNVLKKNIEINGLSDKVVIYNAACGKVKSKGTIRRVDLNDAGSNQVLANGEGSVDVIAIDDLEIPDVDFVKIDVEGGEADVISGMTNTLRKSHPKIFVEIFNNNFARVNKMLNDLGYVKMMEENHNYLYQYYTK